MVRLPVGESLKQRSFLEVLKTYQETGVGLPGLLERARSWNEERKGILSSLLARLRDTYAGAVEGFCNQHYFDSPPRAGGGGSGRGGSLRSCLELELEGVARCALHFAQKKRYVHSYADKELCVKGTPGSRGDVLPLLRTTEKALLDLAVGGCFLVRTGENSRPFAVPGRSLVKPSPDGPKEVFVPHRGWTHLSQADVQMSQVDRDLYLLEIRTGSCKRTRFTDESGNPLEWMSDRAEKWSRFLAVAEYLTSTMKSVAHGNVHIEELIECCKFGGHDHGAKGFNRVASRVNSQREKFGMQPVPLGRDVPFVRIVTDESPFASSACQDPLIAARESLEIDVSHYLAVLAKSFTEDLPEGSTLEKATCPTSVLARDSAPDPGQALACVRSLKNAADRLLSGPFVGPSRQQADGRGSSVENLPEWKSLEDVLLVKEVDLLANLARETGLPRGHCLIGSVWSDDCAAVRHCYVRSEDAHHPLVLSLARRIAAMKLARCANDKNRGKLVEAKTYSRRYGSCGGEERSAVAEGVVQMKEPRLLELDEADGQ